MASIEKKQEEVQTVVIIYLTHTESVGQNLPSRPVNQDKASLPWNTAGFRLWSLAEMMNDFILHRFIGILDRLRQLERASQQPWAKGLGNMQVMPDDIARFVQPDISMLKQDCEFLDLSAAHQRIDQQLRISLRDGITYQQLEQEARVLRELVDNDLPTRRFAYVPDRKARVSDKIGEEWSKAWEKIPASKPDTQEAVYCYALDRNTACVFHLMRSAEFGLRSLAKKVRVKLTHASKNVYPIEYADWGTVIKECKDKIDNARKTLPPGKRQKAMEFYAEIADHCLFMKEIWRNNISHTRKPYNEQEALAVMGRVRDFMIFLANRL